MGEEPPSGWWKFVLCSRIFHMILTVKMITMPTSLCPPTCLQLPHAQPQNMRLLSKSRENPGDGTRQRTLVTADPPPPLTTLLLFSIQALDILIWKAQST